MPIEWLAPLLCYLGCRAAKAAKSSSQKQPQRQQEQIPWQQHHILGISNHPCACWGALFCSSCMVGHTRRNIYRSGKDDEAECCAGCCTGLCACCLHCCLCALPPLCVCQLCSYRKELRVRHKLTGSGICCVDLLCYFCSISQLYTEASYRRTHSESPAQSVAAKGSQKNPMPLTMIPQTYQVTVTPMPQPQTMIPQPQRMERTSNLASNLAMANTMASLINNVVGIGQMQ